MWKARHLGFTVRIWYNTRAMASETDFREAIRRDVSAGTRRLVSEFGTCLFGIAFSLTGNAADAEDLTFRTLERAVEKSEQYDPAREILPWLYSILVNFWKMNRRKKGTNALDFCEEMREAESDVRTPVEELIRKQDAQTVAAAVQALPPDAREVVVLRYYEDLPLKTVAEILSIPYGTAKSRLHAAKRQLREILLRTFSEHPAYIDTEENS